MKHLLTRGAMVLIVAVAINAVLCTGSAQAVEIDWPEPNWPEIFEPNQLLTLHLEMDPCDWNAISKDGLIWNDGTQTYEPNASNPDPYGLEVPARFWMDGEEANEIVVAVRQKSCYPLGDASDRYFKISLKIDINQYYGVDPNAATIWHGLKKLSLENGDDVDVVAEGLACNLHRMAAGPEGYGYDNWYANWVVLNVNGVCRGVYINVEQRDKQFTKHRGLYIHGETWLYKYWGEGDFELKVGDDLNPKSLAVEALCYVPFVSVGDPCLLPTGGVCSTPNDVVLAADMNEYVNMQGLLAMAATNAFSANPDALFSHYNNAYFLDFNLPDPCETRKRMYFAWDQDSVMNSLDWNIYERFEGPTTYQETILGHPTFRSQYNQIMKDLLTGPLTFADINDFLDMVEPVLTDALAADTYNQFDPVVPPLDAVTERFSAIRTWYSGRILNVLAQVDSDEPNLPPGIVLLDDGFDEVLQGVAWDANWDEIAHNWVKDMTTYGFCRPSAYADQYNNGDFTCNALDASDANLIHIDFWFMKKFTDVGEDLLLYYYNGTSYGDPCDLDTLGADNRWLHYTDTITDSNYFVPNFRICFNGTPDGKQEKIWIDDVVVTKKVAEATPCDAANLDGAGLVNFEDYVILANDWRLTGSSLAGDIDANDVVNFGDLDWMFDYWLDDCGQ